MNTLSAYDRAATVLKLAKIYADDQDQADQLNDRNWVAGRQFAFG